jgi:hypothetical protein
VIDRVKPYRERVGLGSEGREGLGVYERYLFPALQFNFIYLFKKRFFFLFLVWFLGMAKVEYILSMPVFVFFVFF